MIEQPGIMRERTREHQPMILPARRPHHLNPFAFGTLLQLGGREQMAKTLHHVVHDTILHSRGNENVIGVGTPGVPAQRNLRPGSWAWAEEGMDARHHRNPLSPTTRRSLCELFNCPDGLSGDPGLPDRVIRHS